MYKILICLLAYSQLSFATKVDLSQMNMTEVAEQALQAALNDHKINIWTNIIFRANGRLKLFPVQFLT